MSISWTNIKILGIKMTLLNVKWCFELSIFPFPLISYEGTFRLKMMSISWTNIKIHQLNFNLYIIHQKSY